MTAPADPAAIVYDLDGTLVDLAVDWDAVTDDVREVCREAGVAVDGEPGLWGLMERAPDHGIASEVESTIAAHECEGAARSARLPAANDLGEATVPVAVCSLNCEAACRIALRKFDLDRHVEAVVGRDSVASHKPDPEPLLAAVREVATTPGETLFVGDSSRDEETARRAGTGFRYVGDGPSDR